MKRVLLEKEELTQRREGHAHASLGPSRGAGGCKSPRTCRVHPEPTLLKSPASEVELSVGPLLLFLVSPYFMVYFGRKKKYFHFCQLASFQHIKKRERLAEAVVMTGIVLSLCNFALALK